MSLSKWLSQLYALPGDNLDGIRVVTMAYGAFSFSFAMQARRPQPLIVLLVAANATWGGL
ncbi:hypothetical protein GCM10008955_33770 [Deinococcus malanensis]|uniref:Uncharacterized protein n=1 Tax=Deinococcus malanensis TaxID=1706855 RepID=A0ABQ2F011_9DEIO|nr:hypothetical protein GCM10008955_33770 [Deinococcus malanensis]